MILNQTLISTRTCHAIIAALVTSSLLACGGTGPAGSAAEKGDSPSPSASVPTSRQTTASVANPATVLAKLALAHGHTVTFSRPAHGGILVTEDGLVGDSPVITEAMAHSSTSELYRILSAGAPVPAELTAAEQDARTRVPEPLTGAPTSAPPKARESRVQSAEMSDPPTDTQTWFQQNFCTLPFLQDCNVAFGETNTDLSQFVNGSTYYVYSMNDPSSTTPATVSAYMWTGIWSLQFTQVVQPQHWTGNFLWASTPMFWSSTMANDPGPLVMGQGAVSPSCTVTNLNQMFGDLGGEFPGNVVERDDNRISG